MSRVSCEQVGPLLEAFRDGLLDGHERELVAVHFSTCAACAFEGEELANALRHEFLFPDHTIDVRDLADQGAWRSGSIVKMHPWRRRRVAIFAAAAAAVVTLVVVLHEPARQTGAGVYGTERSRPTYPKPQIEKKNPRSVGLEIMSAENITLATSASQTVNPGAGR